MDLTEGRSGWRIGNPTCIEGFVWTNEDASQTDLEGEQFYDDRVGAKINVELENKIPATKRVLRCYCPLLPVKPIPLYPPMLSIPFILFMFSLCMVIVDDIC